MKRGFALILCLLTLWSLGACAPASPAPKTPETPEASQAPEVTAGPTPVPAVADASQMTTVEEVAEEGMTPVYAESLLPGDYPVELKSSSSMFRVESALLHVSDAGMTAELTIASKSYLYLYPGTAAEAASAPAERRIGFEENAGGGCVFTIPVEALDAPLSCAAFSRNKELWYDRQLLFRADSLPMEAFREDFFVTAASLELKDGEYSAAVSLSGGSGRASVESPARLTVQGGRCTARIVWGSRNYDYMRLGEERYLPLNTEGNAVFEIPVLYFDRPMSVIADTVAMSEPHEIQYTLRFDARSLEALS